MPFPPLIKADTGGNEEGRVARKGKSSGSRHPVGAQNGALRAARLGAIKSDIVDNLRQHSLSIHATASRHGISTRYIHQLFAADGTSFADFVLHQRLAVAHLMLNDMRFADRSISAIAFEIGFGNVSAFNRVFRRHFGATPNEVREQARSR